MVPLPPPANLNITPTSFADCTMSLRGVWSMIQHLRDCPLLENQDEGRLRAMAIAFLAFGGATDGNHAVPLGELHESHLIAHRNNNYYTWQNSLHDEYMKLVMDMLTWLDRLSGGATVMVHTPGTRPPGTYTAIEEVKLDTFLPIVLLRENPALEPVFARIVQYFAEQVGLPVMQRWDRAKELHEGGARHNTVQPRHHSNRSANRPLIPPSTTPMRTFYGRTPGTIETLIASLAGPVAPPLIGPGPVSVPSAAAPPPSPTTPSSPNPPTSPTPSRAGPASGQVTPHGATPARRPVNRAATMSPEGKDHIKVEYNEGSEPWMREDVLVAAENMEREMTQPPDAPFGYPPRIPFLQRRQHPSSVISELEAYIEELKGIIGAQSDELDHLYAVLEGADVNTSLPVRHAQPTGGSQASDAGSGRGKAVARRERSPSAMSSSAVSSVSSVSASPPPSCYAGSRASTPGGPWVMATAPQSTSVASASRSPPPSGSSVRGHGSRQPGPIVIYGPYTDQCARSLGYPPSVCEDLLGVQQDYGSDNWLAAILRVVSGCSEANALKLKQAMLKDRDL